MRARKRFGQHFLTDQGIIEQILTLLSASPTDNVVEIGPGRGALTFPLLERLERLQAVELDRDLITYLNERCADKGLLLHESDALDFDFGQLASTDKPIRLIGNLPYNISTPLMFHLFSFCEHVQDMVFMVQEEVALRLAAAPGSKAYGRLSVMAQYHCENKYAFQVPPEAFTPPPKVDSAIITMKPYQEKPHQAKDEALLASIVTQAFSQRRKTLRNTLRGILTDEGFEILGISPSARAETLTVSDFISIANHVDSDCVSQHRN